MSANPLKRDIAPPLAHTEEHLLGLCDDHNRWARKIGYPKWYYVEPSKSELPAKILTVDGVNAQEVWTVLEGGYIDYASWSRDENEKQQRRCRWLIKQGMIQ